MFPAEKVKPRRLKRNGWKNKRKTRRFLTIKILMSRGTVINSTICCIRFKQNKAKKYPVNFLALIMKHFIYTKVYNL